MRNVLSLLSVLLACAASAQQALEEMPTSPEAIKAQGPSVSAPASEPADVEQELHKTETVFFDKPAFRSYHFLAYTQGEFNAGSTGPAMAQRAEIFCKRFGYAAPAVVSVRSETSDTRAYVIDRTGNLIPERQGVESGDWAWFWLIGCSKRK